MSISHAAEARLTAHGSENLSGALFARDEPFGLDGDEQNGDITKQSSNNVFGSFWIDEAEFALPVDVIQEVVNEPKHYSPVPLAPAHMIGLFNLRKMIIPVIDLRQLLGYPKVESDGRRKVAIIEDGGLRLGLLFDDTGGVINAAFAARVDFELNPDGEKDVVIEGVLKMDDGKRMINIIDALEILKIKRVPRVSKMATQDGVEAELGERVNCISFQLGHTTCAIDLRHVQEITEMPELHKSQLAHGHMIGNIELRGITMPVVDFRGLISDEPPFKFSPEALKNRKLLVLDLPEGRIGLLVYSIDSIMNFYERDILPFANVALPRRDVVTGCLVDEQDRIVILLDHAKLKSDPLLVQAARSCKEIYPSKQNEASKEVLQAPRVRSTYILFEIEIQLAFDISCVSEIIDRPTSILRPPYTLDFVDGILNLRGELITLIDTRALYGFPSTDSEKQKVLIFHWGDKKYGIIVDSVDEIVTTNTNTLLDVPTIQNTDTSRLVSEDISGCLQVPSRPAGSDPVFVLNHELLIARCAKSESPEESILA